MRFDDPALTLLGRQLGAISRRQLRQLGYTSPQIDAMLRRGHLERASQAVYVRTGSPPSRAREAVVAVLRGPTGTRVTGPLLLALLGCEGYEVDDADFTLLLPPGRRLTGIDVPWRPDPASGRDGAKVVGVPGVTPARNVLELAVDLAEDEALLLAADRLRWRTRVGARALTQLAGAIDDHPGASRLEALGLLDPSRPETPGERDLELILGDGATSDLTFEWQVWVAPDIRVDALLRDCGVVVESDGPTHEGARDRERDAERDRRLRELGYHVVRVTAADRRHPEELRRRILRVRARALAERNERDGREGRTGRDERNGREGRTGRDERNGREG